MFKVVILMEVAVCLSMVFECNGKEITCYFASWKVYRTCKIEDIDPRLCTVLVYAFAGVRSNGTIRVLDDNADIAKGGYKNFNALKTQNPRLRTLLSIAPKGASETFSLLAENELARRTFISDSLDFIRKYGFDGIDVDWEYPTLLGGRPQDRENFPKLLQEVRDEFDKNGYLLTVAVAASERIIEKAYKVPEIARAVHYIHLMAYDYHTYKNGVTGGHTPLFSNNHLNVRYSTKFLMWKGAPASKLLLGVAAYGRTFTLANSSSNGIGAPVTGPGLPGPRSRNPGTLSYDEIIEKEKSWTKKWSEEQQIPYLYHGDQWVGYDDAESITAKANFSNQSNLAGMMMWSIDMDDARGLFGPSYPLLKTINRVL